MIYLDNAATTYPKPEQVYEKMDFINRNLAVNAGRGSYAAAQNAMTVIEDTRKQLKELFHAPGDWEVIFTPSATFAMNQIIFGSHWENKDIVYVSPYEHNSVMRPLNTLRERFEIEIKEMPLAEDKTIDLEQFDYLCTLDKPKAVFATAVSNVTGYILPFEQLTAIAKEQEALVVIDASQAAGLIPLDVRTIGADYYVWAGHKTLYGPFGVGGYIAGHNTLKTLDDYLIGGTGSDSLNLLMPSKLPERLEAGSHNLLAIAGLNEALNNLYHLDGAFDKSIETIFQQEQQLSQYLYEQLAAQNHVVLYPNNISRTDYVGIVSFGIKGYQAQEVGDILDEEYDIAVRTGYHCAPFVHKWIGSLDNGGTVRASLGRFSRTEDVDALVAAVEEIR